MWFADTHYPDGDVFPAVIAPEVVLLLTVHPRDGFQIAFFFDSQQVLYSLIISSNLTYRLQHRAEQAIMSGVGREFFFLYQTRKISIVLPINLLKNLYAPILSTTVIMLAYKSLTFKDKHMDV